MGDNTIPVATDGTRIPASDHNALRTAFAGDLIPRNASAVAIDQTSSLGSSSYTWLNGLIQNIYALTKLWVGAAAKNNTLETDGSDDIVIKRNNVEKLKIQSTGVNASYLINNSITPTQIQVNGLTQATMFKRTKSSSTASLGNVAQSGNCGSYTLSSTSLVDITNLSVTLTTTGRPVLIQIIPYPQTTNCALRIYCNSTGAQTHSSSMYIYRDTTSLYEIKPYGVTGDNNSYPIHQHFLGHMYTIDYPTAGTYTYKISALISATATNSRTLFNNLQLIAYEL